eukprot:1862309-Heterocapsa_arctica.AAC.1
MPRMGPICSRLRGQSHFCALWASPGSGWATSSSLCERRGTSWDLSASARVAAASSSSRSSFETVGFCSCWAGMGGAADGLPSMHCGW